MSDVCSICHKPAKGPYEVEAGPIGFTCGDGECGGMIWEGHLNDTFGATAEERARLKWKIACKRKGLHAKYNSQLARFIDSEVSKIDARLSEVAKEAHAFDIDLALEAQEAELLREIVEASK